MKSPSVGIGISPALVVAQRKLDQLRQQHQLTYQSTGQETSFSHGRERLSLEPPAITHSSLPNHLGWHSPAVTQVLRQTEQKPGIGLPTLQSPIGSRFLSAAPPPLKRSVAKLPTIRLYPDLALGMLRQRQSAAGRIWLLLKYLDRQGKGWIEVEKARQELTAKASSLRVCGWRQLRNLLTQGEGLFWRRQNGLIWLASPAKVAIALGIQRLTARPVSFPLSILQAGIGEVRAHFYASFHSGRTAEQQHSPTRPIARATLEKLTHMSRHTLRAYERTAGVRQQRNFAIGEFAGTAHEQERAWQCGRATFQFTDHKGSIGRPLATYTAWQLPNSYFGPHKRLPKGSQKQLNRQLTVLSTKGMTGNDKPKGERTVANPLAAGSAVAANRPNHCRRFFKSSATAAKKLGQACQTELYWPKQQPRQTRYQIWHWLPGDSLSQEHVK